MTRAVLRAVVALPLTLAAASPSYGSEKREVRFRGDVVCLDEGGEPAATGKECPDDPVGGWAIRTGEGTLHRLSPGDKRVAMLTDVRVRSRELQIEAWQDADGELAIVHLYSVIDGQAHQPHYYCDVCAIKSYTPGLCWCCQEEFEFREPPAED